jgi:hypothetical protein
MLRCFFIVRLLQSVIALYGGLLQKTSMRNRAARTQGASVGISSSKCELGENYNQRLVGLFTKNPKVCDSVIHC